MPLRDHFHPPWSDGGIWEGFHSAWVNTMVRHLNATLPDRFRAFPQVHLGPFVEAVPTAFEGELSGGPPDAVKTPETVLASQDVFEVRVVDDHRGMHLVGVIELVSPRSKDRAEARRAFVGKCASYIREEVGLVLVDIVTASRASFHQELQRHFFPPVAEVESPGLYAVAYRSRLPGKRWCLDASPVPLSLGTVLPEMTMWLAGRLPVRLDLEATYEETCQVLRIE